MKMYLTGCLLMLSSVCVADSRFVLGLGAGTVDVPDDLLLDSPYVGEDAPAVSAYFGKTLDTGLLVDLGISVLTDDVFFGANDNMRFGALEALFGYRFVYRNIYLEPKIGYSRWHRIVEEGAFLNPGPESRRSEYGTDPLYMLTTGYRLSENFGLSLSYRHQELGDQKAETVFLGLGFPF